MKLNRAIHSVLSSALLVTASLGVACGGFSRETANPPPGESVPFEPIAVSGLSCGRFVDSATLIETTEDLDAFLADCPQSDEDGEASAALAEAVSGLSDNEQLVVVSIALGGCIQEYHLLDVTLDGATLHPWISKVDTSVGQPDVACTADVGEANEVLVVEADAEDAEVHVTSFNPDAPDNPLEMRSGQSGSEPTSTDG